MYYQNGVHTDVYVYILLGRLGTQRARWGMPFRRRNSSAARAAPYCSPARQPPLASRRSAPPASQRRWTPPALGLRPLVEEDHTSAVDDVGLHAADVQRLLHLRDPHHVVVGGPSYLYTDAQRPATRRG
ncbi:unnamed protein product [Spirodela intermedia]|uniref:Uncharacterized protein n=1 Tax=Spirodela intermedia TaxID=51605 RepID=A0A7I8IEN7_SPIIN|nr:unnamed protein product [Spirodela intermedia]CAA6655563.1 unnamed protein product [Spirodela intermedia]